ncbi:hypothetical protein Fcan01_10450 [Folsomia candida]|uniref:Uncharacterized protein n=1 Tax=Folsomia candida TaxID=158441 RepID=A0A226E8L8_FOLCA|nr:hypothetical protein Fcan01_10450 [Folsomia candida]
MIHSRLVGRIKRHLKYTDVHHCIFTKWEKDGIVLKERRHHFPVFLSICLHGVWNICQGVATITRSKSIVQRAEASSYGRSERIFLNLVSYLFDLLEIGCWGLSIMMSLLTTFLPCHPPLMSSLFCRNDTFPLGPFPHAGFAFMEGVVMQQAVMGGSYYLLTIVLISVSFLFLECKTLIKGDVQKYRNLQVYEKVLNSCTKGRIFPVTMWIIPCVQIGLGIINIKLGQSNDVDKLRMLVFSGAYLVLLIFTMTTFSAAGEVNSVSKMWIQQCNRTVRTKGDKLLKKSLQPLKIQFGSNFAEALTPLVVQGFCISQTASALMVMH